MSDSEKWFDSEIAPKLLELCNQCGDRGMSFLCTVEYAPGEHSTTRRLVDPGLLMTMLAMHAQAGVNIDGYIIGLIRHLKEKGISWESSMVLTQLGGRSPQKRNRDHEGRRHEGPCGDL